MKIELRTECALAALGVAGVVGVNIYLAVSYFRKRARQIKQAAGHFVEITDGT